MQLRLLSALRSTRFALCAACVCLACSQGEESASGGAGGDVGSGGASGGTTATGGAVTGGGGSAGSSGGSASGGASADAPRPSPGCGKNGRPAGGKVYQAGVSWLVFPEKYDGETPLPVLFGFHGCGSYNFGDANRTEFWDVTRNSGFETDYVVAIPLAASGNCFDYDTDIVRAKALYDDLVENYCVDLDRVFGTGHSSGAGFLVSILASNHQADFEHFNFRGIAPVSAWLIGGHATEVPTMYIESVDDTERGEGNAQAVVDKFIDVNACATTSTPYAVDACNSSHDGDPVNAGCRSYDACSAVTIWCSHDDSAYSGTFHGIPCFYRQAVYDFFEGL